MFDNKAESKRAICKPVVHQLVICQQSLIHFISISRQDKTINSCLKINQSANWRNMPDLMLHKFHRALGENKFCWGKQNLSRENKFHWGKTNSIGGKQIPLRDKNSIPSKALATKFNAVNPLIRILYHLEGQSLNLSKCLWHSIVTLGTSALTRLQLVINN